MTPQKQFLYCVFFAAFQVLVFRAEALEPGVWTWDLGVASGSYKLPGPPDQSVVYSEADFGLNYSFLQNWMWRNAIFVRFPTGYAAVEGLDTGPRLYGHLDFGSTSGLASFLGLGYRFETDRYDSPFVEAGLMFNIEGLTMGGGAKIFFEKLVRSSVPTYVQYFIILSGSGTL
jgi:hypothetical protein